MLNTFEISLKPTELSDLECLFQFQLDEDSGYMAAFMPENHTDRSAYFEKHSRLLKDPTVNSRTIMVGSCIVGSIAKFERQGVAEITYWIDRFFWGKGIATIALQRFLTIENSRPLVARVVFDNYGSHKVLEKSGFIKRATDKGFASARQTEVQEYIYRLL